MADQHLQEFYETKYAAESTDHQPSIVPRTDRPIDRFEGAVAALAPRVEGKDVLELAAGAGTIVQSLIADRSAFRSWLLSDIADVRVRGMRLRAGGDPRLDFAVVDAADAASAFDDRTFDVIVSIALIEHLVDPISAMIATRKLLRPGGFVYLDTPNVAKWTRRIKLAMGRFPSTASLDEGLVCYDGSPVGLHDEGHLHYFTFASLERLLVERCGFAHVEAVPYGIGRRPSPALSYGLARRWPSMFTEIAILAHV